MLVKYFKEYNGQQLDTYDYLEDVKTRPYLLGVE